MTLPVVIPIEWREPSSTLTALGAHQGVLGFIGGGAHPLARWSYVMDNPIRLHQWTEGDAGQMFEGLQRQLELLDIQINPDISPFQGGWAGLLSYEFGRAFEDLPWPGQEARPNHSIWPDVWLGLYDTIAIFDAASKSAKVISWGIDETHKLDPTLAARRARDFAQRLGAVGGGQISGAGQGLQSTRSRADAEAAIGRAVRYIHDGDIFQANISIGFEGALAKDDTPVQLFNRLIGRHPSPFATFLSLGDKAVVSHSPERFLSRTASGQLETRPIKGTMPRHKDPQKDQLNARILTDSKKDRAENLMIVDLMRNDLSRVCIAGSVKVPRLCALESFSTVHHLVSDVIGQQKPGLNFFDALAASFPPGSITGAPKVRAMEIIAELEGEPRGPWCGSMIRVGFDGSADSSVLIRTAACVQHGDQWHIKVRAGAGIVADSLPEREYDEMLTKAKALSVAAKNDPLGSN